MPNPIQGKAVSAIRNGSFEPKKTCKMSELRKNRLLQKEKITTVFISFTNPQGVEPLAVEQL